MWRSCPTIGKLRALLALPPHGVAIVEFALALPFIILLIVGLFDLGFGFYQSLQIQGAAEAGAQYAALHRWDKANIENAVRTATNFGTQVTPVVVQVCGCTDTANNFTELATPPSGGTSTVLGDCSSQTCSGCTTSIGTACPAGLYAKVRAELSYSPVLPYPGMPDTLTLSGKAYRRLK